MEERKEEKRRSDEVKQVGEGGAVEKEYRRRTEEENRGLIMETVFRAASCDYQVSYLRTGRGRELPTRPPVIRRLGRLVNLRVWRRGEDY